MRWGENHSDVPVFKHVEGCLSVFGGWPRKVDLKQVPDGIQDPGLVVHYQSAIADRGEKRGSRQLVASSNSDQRLGGNDRFLDATRCPGLRNDSI